MYGLSWRSVFIYSSVIMVFISLVVSELGNHYKDVIASAMASQSTSPTIVYSTVYSGPDQRKHQNSASLAFVPAQRASNAENASIWWRHQWILKLPSFWRINSSPIQPMRCSLCQQKRATHYILRNFLGNQMRESALSTALFPVTFNDVSLFDNAVRYYFLVIHVINAKEWHVQWLANLLIGYHK